MNKHKHAHDVGLRDWLLQAQGFHHTIFAQPRQLTRHMSSIVQYPQLINDVGRTVNVRRAGNDSFTFHIRQKRYLGRGTYAVSADATGVITYDDEQQQTRISGHVKLGGQYVFLLIIMTLFAMLSLSLVFITILFVPLALLIFAVLGLHWMYLFHDRRELQEELSHLVDITERSIKLTVKDDAQSLQALPVVTTIDEDPISLTQVSH